MKKIFQLCFGLAFFTFGYAQELRPVAQKVADAKIAKKTFVKYDLFAVSKSSEDQAKYSKAAADVTVMNLNSSELKRISAEKPQALEMNFAFEGRTIELELVKNDLFTNDFRVHTDKGVSAYTPGVYYQGIVKGDNESVVAVSFFKDDVVAVTSIKNIGNVILGKAKNSQDFVSFNDAKLKGENPLSCGADELVENQKISAGYDPKTMTSKKTSNCVRIYYEAGYGPYTQNGSDVTATVNWVTAMHNNISTLYANDGITVALSEVFVWTTTDPYTGSPSNILNQFRTTRTSFNGDVAQLLRNPATTSIAYVDALCTPYKYSYSGVNSYYNNVPTYSWNIEAMTHEIGHNLGSPHTHACFWNGNNTAIDGCGPASGNNEGCDAPLPTNGGTIMSYCHLVSSVGINFANGFGTQPAALIRNTINARGCLGTNCITSCEQTVTGLVLSDITANSATATITDNVASSWKFRLSKMDGTVVQSGISTTKVIVFNNLDAGTYYNISIGTDCSGPEAFSFSQLLLTDADWCGGVKFTDPGGENGNYYDNQSITKTFYPSTEGRKMKITFTQFATEAGYDYMTVYNGPHTGSPRFNGGTNISGNTIPGPFTSTHETGAITVKFASDPAENAAGWVATFDCSTLASGENGVSKDVVIARTNSKGIFTITAKNKIDAYEVYDMTGKTILSVNGKNSVETLNLSAVPVGTYIIKIQTDNETVIKKVNR